MHHAAAENFLFVEHNAKAFFLAQSQGQQSHLYGIIIEDNDRGRILHPTPTLVPIHNVLVLYNG